MAQTIQYQPVRLIETGGTPEPTPFNIAAAAGQTLAEGDFATIAAGQLSKAAANATLASLAGIVRKGNDSVYYNANPSKTTLFGAAQSGTALIPGTNQNPEVFGLQGLQFEINIINTHTLAAADVGTQVGLNYDATSGYFFVDPAQANKVAEIVAISGGPDAQNSAVGAAGIGNGVIGDSGGRVVVQFLAGTAL